MGISATVNHYGLHAWSIYALVGLALAFFTYNKGLPLTILSAFYPLLGERTWGWPGHIIDILAVFATLFGLATSLGIGAQQISAGLSYLFGIPSTTTSHVFLIFGITIIALISVIRGLDGGVKRLSEINIALAFGFLIFVTLAGSTYVIITGVFSNTIHYLKLVPALNNWIGREDVAFLHDWTTFYWAWWIAWSPFVGMFIARISKGRSVREFLICVLIVPTLLCIVWMTVFGGSAIEQYEGGYQGVVDAVTKWNPEVALFKFLSPLPFSGIASTIGIFLIVVFFVISMDSGSLVIDIITASGKIDAPVAQRIFWCCFEGLVAIALLLGGGLASLQALTLATGFPFCIVLLLMIVSLFKGLKSEIRT